MNILRHPAIWIWLLACSAPAAAARDHTHEALIRRYFSEWANRADVQAADALIATNLVTHHGDEITRGLDAFKQSILGLHRAFPDVHFAVDDLVTDDGKVLVRWRMTGTQRGPFLGRAPSGKKVNVTGMSLFRISNDRIQEIWVQMDRLTLFQQLGLSPSPAAPPAGSPPQPAVPERPRSTPQTAPPLRR